MAHDLSQRHPACRLCSFSLLGSVSLLAGLLLGTAGCSRKTPSDADRQCGPRIEIAAYILADRSDESGDSFDEYISKFVQNGSSPDGFLWLKLPESSGSPQPQEWVIARRDDAPYVLAYLDRERGIDQQDNWSVRDIRYERDDQRRSGSLTIQLDDRGAERMCSLTRANIGKWMAVTLSGEVMTVARIMSEIGATIQVSGDPDRMDTTYARWQRAKTSR